MPGEERRDDDEGRRPRGLSAVLAAADGLALRLVALTRGLLLGPLLFGVFVGGGVWAIRNPSLLPVIASNEPSQEAVASGLLHVLVAAAAFLVVARVAERAGRDRHRPATAAKVAGRLCRHLAPLLSLPFLAFLRVPSIEQDRPHLTLVFISLCAGLAAAGAYAWGRDAALRPLPRSDATRGGDRLLERAALAAVVAAWAGYALFFSHLAINCHHALHTRTADLGYYDNIFYQTIHGRPLGCSFLRGDSHASAHFDPILVLLSPLYWLSPRAELLLVVQSVWLGGGVLPVYVLARRRLASVGGGLVFAAAYLLYPALHGANLYEFHSLSLIGPLLLWLFVALEARAHRAYFALAFLILLCREDLPLLLTFVGLAGVIDHATDPRSRSLDARAERVRIGWLTIALSLAYGLLVRGLIMPSAHLLNGGAGSYAYDVYYRALIPNDGGLADVFASLATNPAFVVANALTEPKVMFVLLLLVPLAFLPLLARPGRIMLAFGALACLLASEPAMSSVHFYYASLIFPIAFAIAPAGLAELEERPFVTSLGLDRAALRRALLTVVLVASALVSWKFGAIVENRSFRDAVGPIPRRLTDDERATYAWIEAAARRIPPGASVAVTNRTGPHVSNRRAVSLYRADAQSDYVLIDEAVLTSVLRSRHDARVASGELVELTRFGTLVLFQRR